MLPKLPKTSLLFASALAMAFTVLISSGRSWASAVNDDTTWIVPLSAPALLVAEFRAPLTAYGAGHRGIDYSVTDKALVYAPATGTVVYSGKVALKPVVVIQHHDGLKSAFEPVCGKVPLGATVLAGEPIGVVCGTLNYESHCQPMLCLHFSVRRDGSYLSPRVFIGGLPPVALRY